jgi:predicted ATPase
MLTRLKVRGFKNLFDLDTRFGPFTCVAGLNGAGKSNIFDAILLLSSLADHTLLEAVTGVRGETRSAEAARVFSRSSSRPPLDELSLEAEMLVPRRALDDLDQPAEAATTGLRYAVSLRLRHVEGAPVPRLELAREQLEYIKRGEADEAFPFARTKREWLGSVFVGGRRTPFISTETTEEGTFIKLHEDSHHQGRARKLRADSLTRTVLSTINTSESPTALVVRRELQSWRLLQLEPSRLRNPDDVKAPAVLREDGSGLAATVHRLLERRGADEAAVRAKLTNRLAELLESVRDVRVDVDDKRELITLLAKGVDGVEHRARDLSDGTLRFLALAVLELDTGWRGTLCMEEPENGIHPTRMPAMLDLLQDLAVNLEAPVDEENPLRQVIINTHSPEVAALVPDDALLYANARPSVHGAASGLVLQPLSKTWRDRENAETVPRGVVLEMLNATYAAIKDAREHRRHVVATRPDFEQLVLPGTPPEGMT